MKYKAIKRVMKDINKEWYLDFRGYLFEEHNIFTDKHIDNISKDQLQDIKQDLNIILTELYPIWLENEQIEDVNNYKEMQPKLNHLLKML